MTFQCTLVVNIWMELLNGLWSYGDCKGVGYPQVFDASSSEIVHQTRKCFRGGKCAL